MSNSLYAWGLSRPWCITHEALDMMLALAARDEVDTDELKQAMHGPKALALRDGQRRDDSPTMRVVDGVARIVLDGPIYRYADYFTRYSGGVTTEQLAKDFQRALDDPTVGAIAFVVDSPGGDATAINELADTIHAARGKKPIGAYVEGYGASAAYWIASAVDPGMLMVDDTALIGSIGTIIGVPDPSKRPSSRIDIVSTQSPKKRVDPTTPEGRAVLQQMADDMTEVFIAKVMRNRGITREQVLAVEGGMRIGAQAIAAGLADRLGSEDLLLRELAVRAAKRAPLSQPPARVPGGNPLRMENPMKVFSKEWWKELMSAQAETEAPSGEAVVAESQARTVRISAEQLAQIEAAASVIGVSPLKAAAEAPTQDARDAELQALRERIAKQETAALQAKAEAFADGAIRTHQALPAERAQLIALYTQSAATEAGTATLEALITARPPHTLASEQVQIGAGGVLESGAVQGVAPERRARLLSLTPLGQAAAKQPKRA